MPTPDNYRPGAFRDFYRPLRDKGCGWFSAGALAVVWVLFGGCIQRET